MNAIQESQIAVVVFSESYADSSWCLEELEHIMKCKHERGQIVLPVFYNVDPSDVRKQKRKYEEAFSKHGLLEKNYQRVESWRKALLDASNIAGWETKHIANGHEAVGIQIMVGNVLDKLLSVKSNVEENLVGMGPRLQYLESQLQIGSPGVRMIGIWGLGGGGKTTLAYSVYMKIRDYFQGHCFIGNIREESAKHNLKTQQQKVLSEVLKTQVSLASDEEGRHKIKSMLCRRNVLIVLDDVDDLEQLEALAGSHDWFGGGSRIIITTRDEHVLSRRVDAVCRVSLLSYDEAVRLFKRHAYQEDNPVEDYDELSFRVISYVNGLPLALKILGSFLYDKDKSEWISILDKLRVIPNRKVTGQLKISYDGLEHDEKQIFLDIACFFRRCQKEEVMSILEANGFHANIGIKVLIQKALITISSDSLLDMHDLVKEMGHHIVRREHPNNPAKRSRVWRSQDIEDICSRNATKVKENNKIKAIRYVKSVWHPPSKSFTTLVSNLKMLRFLYVNTRAIYDEGPTFISNELKYMSWYAYPASPLPESFQPRKLVVLNLHGTLQIELWNGDKHLPCLKELHLTDATSLVKTPNFAGLPCLQKLILVRCDCLEEIHQSLGHHASLVYLSVCSCKNLTKFPSIFQMEKLEVLYISDCEALLEFPKIEANMDSLVNLHLKNVGIEVLPSSVGRYCTNLLFLNVEKCSKLKRIEGNFHALKRLHVASVRKLECLRKESCLDLECWRFNNLPPSPLSPRFLRKLNLSGCRLKDGEIPRGIDELLNLQELRLCNNYFSRLEFSLFQLTRLKLLDLNYCYNLVELPDLPSNLSILKARGCVSFKAIRDDVHRNCKWLCLVSVTNYGFHRLVGGERLLETILKGKALCMSIKLQGLAIPKGFKLCLVKGRRCRLKLPKNWFNEFSGFLFCFSKIFNWFGSVKITIRQEEKLQMGMRDSYDGQVFCEEESDHIHTWMGYVSFGSLSCTAWWDITTTAVDVSVDLDSRHTSFITGFGVRLVSKKNQMEETTTTTNNSCADDDYKCKFEILHDSESWLECRFGTI